jgi:hypothetical protein
VPAIAAIAQEPKIGLMPVSRLSAPDCEEP